MIASELGVTSAPAVPCSARAAINAPSSAPVRTRARARQMMGHTNIATTRRLYAGDWREAEERNTLVLRQLADAGISQ